MRRFVNVNDVVVVQDLQNNGAYLVIHGVIKRNSDTSTIIHVFDIETNTVVSSALEVYDTLNNQVVSRTFVIE